MLEMPHVTQGAKSEKSTLCWLRNNTTATHTFVEPSKLAFPTSRICFETPDVPHNAPNWEQERDRVFRAHSPNYVRGAGSLLALVTHGMSQCRPTQSNNIAGPPPPPNFATHEFEVISANAFRFQNQVESGEESGPGGFRIEV